MSIEKAMKGKNEKVLYKPRKETQNRYSRFRVSTFQNNGKMNGWLGQLVGQILSQHPYINIDTVRKFCFK